MTIETRLFILALMAGCARPPAEGSPGPTGTSVPDPEPTVEPEPEPTADALFPASSVQVHPAIGSIVVITWEQSRAADVHVAWTFEGETHTSPVRALSPGAHEELLLGIPYGVEVVAQLHGDDGGGITSGFVETITTADLPAGIPAATVSSADAARYDAAGAPYWFVSLAEGSVFSDPWWSLILDRAGRVVWASRSPAQRIALHARVARDGRSLLLDRNSYWPLFDAGVASTIDRVAIDGTVLHTYAVPGLHHPFVDLPDGAIAWGATVQGYANETIQIVHDDGTVEVVFDCMAWLAAIGEYGYCMSNTLSYDEASDDLLFSLFSTETILRIDRSTGAAEAWWGHSPGSWAFDPPESEFWWQHGAHVTPTGTLLLSSDLTRDGVETIVREYTIDEAAETLREVWSYGIGEGVYGYQLGEVVRLPNGNTLHNYGERAEVREVTPDGTLVWQVAWDSTAIGRSMPIADLYRLAP